MPASGRCRSSGRGTRPGSWSVHGLLGPGADRGVTLLGVAVRKRSCRWGLLCWSCRLVQDHAQLASMILDGCRAFGRFPVGSVVPGCLHLGAAVHRVAVRGPVAFSHQGLRCRNQS